MLDLDWNMVVLCGAAVQRNFELLEKVQIEAVRTIRGLRADSAKRILYNDLGLKTLIYNIEGIILNLTYSIPQIS